MVARLGNRTELDSLWENPYTLIRAAGVVGFEPTHPKARLSKSRMSAFHHIGIEEGKGFEPLCLLQQSVFETVTIDHSVNLPKFDDEKIREV